MEPPLKFIISSDPQILSVVRSAVEELAVIAGFPGSECRAIALAVHEALTNIIRHAYQNRHDQTIELHCTRDEHGLEFVLLDCGQPADPIKLLDRPPDELRPGGRGMPIIHSVMDQVHYEAKPDHNQLKLVKYLKPADHEEGD